MRAPSSLNEIVAEYRAAKLPHEQEYLRFYREQPSLSAAIELSAMARCRDNSKFSHQRRIPPATLDKLRRALLAKTDRLRPCHDFRSLHHLIRDIAAPIRGIGELAVYDTAHRIGAFLQLRPQEVFVHAGVRSGVRALGLDHRAESLPISVFPRELRTLSPEQIEDCLCIYKAALRNLAGKRALPTRLVAE